MKYHCIIEDKNEDAILENVIDAESSKKACGEFLALCLSPMVELLSKDEFEEYKKNVRVISCERV